MSLCSICLETLRAPVSIPCGHVFCDSCLLSAVSAKKPSSSMNSCPTCRTSFSIVNIDPALVPAHLQPYVVPSIRKLYMDDSTSQSSDATPTSSSFVMSEYNRLVAENKALKTNCWVWRRRAETHAAATIGLLNVARITKERAEQLQHEKEELERNCSILKLELQEVSFLSKGSPESRSPSPEPDHETDDPTPNLLLPDLHAMPAANWLDKPSFNADHDDGMSATLKTIRSRGVDESSLSHRSTRSPRRHHPYLHLHS